MAARRRHSRADAGMVRACASCLSMPCSRTRSSMSRQSSWPRLAISSRTLLEDIEQIGATADEYLRLGLRQVPVAQGCEVSPHAPIRHQRCDQALQFLPQIVEIAGVYPQVSLGQVQVSVVDVLSRVGAATRQADDPVYRAIQHTQFAAEGEIAKQSVRLAPQFRQFCWGDLWQAPDLRGLIEGHQLVEPRQQGIHCLFITGDL